MHLRTTVLNPLVQVMDFIFSTCKFLSFMGLHLWLQMRSL